MKPALVLLPLAALLTAADLPPPAATIGSHGLTFPQSPAIQVGVPASAHYAGGDRFVLLDMADCELHLFVEADRDRKIRRYWWVQREAYLPNKPGLTHDYKNGAKDARETHWGKGVWVRPRFGPTGEGETPGSDSAHIRAIVNNAGYTLPPEMMSVRLVRLIDEQNADGHGREELMIIYAEDLASTGLRNADLIRGTTVDPRWDAIARALTERAEKNMTVRVGS